jgi:hypothetical protein
MSDTLGISLALDSQAVSQYTRWPFTDFFELGGQQYGLCPAGIFLIGGDTDAGEEIAWQVSGPKTDAGSTAYKRARSLTVSGPNTENVEPSIVFDTGQEPTIGRQQLGGRFYVGRDGAGRAVQFTLSGTGPVDITGITLDVLMLGQQARG